ncbi:MAG: glycosyltransferase [Acidimicrobiia bacterium]
MKTEAAVVADRLGASSTAVPAAAGVAKPCTGRVALVHDYLTQRGGAERVVMSMLRAFPEADLHTSIYYPDGTFPEIDPDRVKEMSLSRVGAFRRHHRVAFPFLAPAFTMKHIEADVVLCSSSGWAHAARSDGRKIVYCHAPARWLYQSDRYLRGRRKVEHLGLGAFQTPLRHWDRWAARRADRYLTNSSSIRDQIRNVYGIDAEVLHPPPTLDIHGDQEAPVGDLDPGFLLCVTRLLPYKNVDRIIDAVRGRSEQLVIVGAGTDAPWLVESAPANVRPLGMVSDAQLRWLYARCGALISASYEDFGITTLEAASFGRPTIALRFGGFLDTILEDETGVFFQRPEPRHISDALDRFGRSFWDADKIVEHARMFDEESFITRLQRVVAEEMRA